MRLMVLGATPIWIRRVRIWGRCERVNALSKSRKTTPHPFPTNKFTVCIQVCEVRWGVNPCWWGPAMCVSAGVRRKRITLLIIRTRLFSSAMGLKCANLGGNGVFGLGRKRTKILKEFGGKAVWPRSSFMMCGICPRYCEASKPSGPRVCLRASCVIINCISFGLVRETSVREAVSWGSGVGARSRRSVCEMEGVVVELKRPDAHMVRKLWMSTGDEIIPFSVAILFIPPTFDRKRNSPTLRQSLTLVESCDLLSCEVVTSISTSWGDGGIGIGGE